MEHEQKENGFMLQIWGITLLSMCVSAGIMYGYHHIITRKEAKINSAEIGAIQFRMEKYTAYKTSIETLGREKARELIIEE